MFNKGNNIKKCILVLHINSNVCKTNVACKCVHISQDPHVEMYRINDIESKLGITRDGLVALGLMVGCDFVPKGVPGVGIANAVKLLQSLAGRDVIIR